MLTFSGGGLYVKPDCSSNEYKKEIGSHLLKKVRRQMIVLKMTDNNVCRTRLQARVLTGESLI